MTDINNLLTRHDKKISQYKKQNTSVAEKKIPRAKTRPWHDLLPKYNRPSDTEKTDLSEKNILSHQSFTSTDVSNDECIVDGGPTINNSKHDDPQILDNSIAIKREQSGNKVGTKWEQSGNKVGTKVGTKWEQSGNKVGTKWEQKNSPEKESGYKSGNKSGNKVGTKWEQSGNKVGTNMKICDQFSSLTGVQRRIVLAIYDNCKFNNCSNTSSLALIHIAKICNTDVKTARTSIKRLCKKNIINRIEFKNGRGGWTKYTLKKDVHNEIWQFETWNKVGTKWEQSGNKVGTKLGSELGTSPCSSSSSYIYNKTTTTTDEESPNLERDQFEIKWANVEFPQCLKNLQFGDSVISQVSKIDSPKITPKDFQESIDAFAFDVEVNKIIEDKKIRNSVAYFLASIRKFGTYQRPPNYRSDEDVALEEMVKRSQERLEKQKEFESKFFDIEFDIWLSNLSETEKRDKKYLIGTYMGQIHRASLKDLFKTEFWPSIWEQIKEEKKKNCTNVS